MSKDDLVTNFVAELSFDQLIVLANIVEVEHDEENWLDYTRSYHENVLRVQVMAAFQLQVDIADSEVHFKQQRDDLLKACNNLMVIIQARQLLPELAEEDARKLKKLYTDAETLINQIKDEE